MKKTKEENMDFLKLSLYLVSLWILFFMLIVLKVDVSNVPFELSCKNMVKFLADNVVSCVCIFLIILGGIGYYFFRDKLNNAKRLPVKIKSYESINYENLSFLATYIIPLVCFPMETEREVFVLFCVIIIIGCIFVRTNLYYTNPSLILLGFNIYKVTTNSQGEFKSGILILKGKICEGESVKYLPLSDEVYFGRKI